MIYDLLKIRKAYGLTAQEFSKYAGISASNYLVYEKEGDIPSKYIYNLWTRLPNFPIPKDFFYYTSTTLDLNMRYHRISQVKIAEMFGFSTQATISGYIKDNHPMYEKKQCFIDSFSPLIIPFAVEINENEEENDVFYPLTELKPSGMLTDKYVAMAKKRGETRKERIRQSKYKK